MARARSSGGGAAFAWALVVAGTGFFIFLILFIVTYTQNETYQQEAQQARDALQRYVNEAQRGSADVREIVSNLEARQTVVSKLLDDTGRLKALITPDANRSVEAIRQEKVEDRQIDPPLLTHVDALDQTIAATEQQVEAARQAQAAAEQRAADLADERDKLAAKFDEALAQAASGFDATAERFVASTEGYDELAASLRSDMEQTRSQLQEQIDEKDAQIEELRATNAVLRQRVAELERERSRVLGPSDAIPADGEVISLVPGQNQVYINRGAEDYIQLGMTFEVFGDDELIKLNNYDELRGKATIEIISMDDTTAVARVVRKRRGESLTPGDQIANLVYDANAQYKFHIYGDFDIDNTGQPTTRDRDRIKSMITRWGAEVSDELNWDVDFLVLGKEPPIPEPLDADEIDPTVIRAHAEASENYETYNELAATARELSVPVLNQNRFLALTGYYRR